MSLLSEGLYKITNSAFFNLQGMSVCLSVCLSVCHACFGDHNTAVVLITAVKRPVRLLVLPSTRICADVHYRNPPALSTRRESECVVNSCRPERHAILTQCKAPGRASLAVGAEIAHPAARLFWSCLSGRLEGVGAVCFICTGQVKLEGVK
jgi:hypothetical protein